MHHLWYTIDMNEQPILQVIFFHNPSGREPVREWLKAMDKEDRTLIGEDIKLVQFRWPLGMPLVRKLAPDLWEVRSHLSTGRIARVFFTVHKTELVLLHGFIKKSQKTPNNELALAQERKNLWWQGVT